MGDLGEDMPLTPPTDRVLLRRAAVHVADRIAAENPHPLDDGYPALAGQAIARDPAVRDEIAEFFDLLGIKPSQVRKGVS